MPSFDPTVEDRRNSSYRLQNRYFWSRRPRFKTFTRERTKGSASGRSVCAKSAQAATTSTRQRLKWWTMLSSLACIRSRASCGSSVLLILACAAGCAVPFTSSSDPIVYESTAGRHVIVCLGDSLTAGHGASQSQAYPAWLQRRINSYGYPYAVVNAGVNGNRVADGLNRLHSDVLKYHPSIVIVELGSNDPGHTSASVWQSQLETIVSRLQSRGIRVVLGGLEEPGMSQIYRSVAARFNIPLVWMSTGLWSRPGLWSDAHHPNGAGYKIVMENVWKALAALLRA